MDFPDTIFALSSGPGPSAVAVIRLSGNRVRFALETMAGIVPPPRRALYRTLRGEDGGVIDRGIVLFFPGPGNVTGEDCGELQIHGGRAVVEAMLRMLAALPGLRLAEAGEFTRRAFLNGRMDLTEVEGLSDLIAAETEWQRRLAVQGSGGRDRQFYESWRTEILRLRAMVEAELDFSDQDDVEGVVPDRVRSTILDLLDRVATHRAGFGRAEIVRRGYRVVILGAPNAGKSSLLNALARREAAIVSDEAGTTRDPVEVQLDLDGAKVVLTDTAGIRENAGKIEAIGIERALGHASDADLILSIVDLNAPHPVSLPPGPRWLSVGTKLDVAGAGDVSLDICVSATVGTGLEELVERLGKLARESIGDLSDPLPFRRRHVAWLERAEEYLAAAAGSDLAELRAEELRLAGDALGSITGAIGTEEVLGEIFSRFCIGK